VTQNLDVVRCNVLAESGQNVEDWSVHSGTEETDGTVLGTERQWTDCRRQQ